MSRQLYYTPRSPQKLTIWALKWLLCPRTDEPIAAVAVSPFASGVRLPEQLGDVSEATLQCKKTPPCTAFWAEYSLHWVNFSLPRHELGRLS